MKAYSQFRILAVSDRIFTKIVHKKLLKKFVKVLYVTSLE
jgi:hypothetical protein